MALTCLSLTKNYDTFDAESSAGLLVVPQKPLLIYYDKLFMQAFSRRHQNKIDDA